MASISTFFKRFFDQKNATVTASVHASLSFNATASATASMTSMLQLVGGVSARSFDVLDPVMTAHFINSSHQHGAIKYTKI